MKISVVIPTVSRLEFLRDALRSLEAQTLRDFEVVIGDNSASAEYAAQIDALVAGLAHLDIRVFHHPRDLGMVGNCNFLIDAARGDYWLYLPDDDRHCPESLARLASALDAEPRAGIAFSDHSVMNERGEVDAAASRENSRLFGREALRAGFHGRGALFELALAQVFELQSMMFRRELIAELRFREESGPVPDFELQLRLWRCEALGGAVYVPERLNEYRHHGAQWTVTTDFRRVQRAIIRALVDHAPPGALRLPAYRRKLAFHHAALAALEASHGDAPAARAQALAAVRLDPTRPRVLASLAHGFAPPAVVRSARKVFSAARTFASRVRRGR